MYDHRLDIVIGPVELLERRSGLMIERVLKGRNVIVCRRGHKLAHKKRVSVADLEAAT
jgi:DNA-binding transcriptional LysR family regulator